MVLAGWLLAWSGMDPVWNHLHLYDHRYSVWSGVLSHRGFRVLSVWTYRRGERKRRCLHVLVERDLGDLRWILALARRGNRRNILLLHHHRHPVRYRLLPNREGQFRAPRQEGRVAVNQLACGRERSKSARRQSVTALE